MGRHAERGEPSSTRTEPISDDSTSFVGALLPYVLSPSTYRAAKELQRLRVQTDGTKASFMSYTVRF